jgi:multidrug transporter EmrE-like cation transporter
MNYAYLVVAILCEVIATSALKSAEGFTRIGPSIIVVIGYGLAFYCLSSPCGRFRSASPMPSGPASGSS